MAEPLSRALTQCAYTIPTPVQVQALPPQLANRDMLALAETGSGKTAAFVLPILNEFATNPIDPAARQVATLILAPTRELAIQIDAEVASLSRNMRIRHAVVLGGVSKGPQINALKRGLHVLVATPGRLLDHVTCRNADLSQARTLVLDEADRMFDMGFIRDIRRIASLVPKSRRTAMLSATMPPEIRTLAHELLNDPFRIDLSPKQIVVDRIDQKVMIVRMGDKQSRLHTILNDSACTRVIVFTRTKRGADRVTDRLQMAGISAVAIHGNKAQNARQRALNDFSSGRVKVLVATDIAARGIDVSDISHVINFDMPMEAETYVHRIGRTARKGLSGVAISLCDPGERGEILAIERLMKQKIDVIDDVGGEAVAMPERRPHRAHVDPRSKGPARNKRPGAFGRNSGKRDETTGRTSDRDTGREGGRNASNGDNRRPVAAGASANASAQRDGKPAWRPEEQKAERRDAPRREDRLNTERNTRPAKTASNVPSELDTRKQHRKGQRRPAPANAAAAPGNRGDGKKGPSQNNWNGNQPPKFLRQKSRDGASRRDPNRVV